MRSLERYNEMRDFGLTAEPRGGFRRSGAAAPDTPEGEKGQALSFVVQKHDATRLHYDFRLELDGVLLSWAVPKGPSLWTKDRRLAVQTEDHPIDYRDFEGTIPGGQYGGGPVIVWDRGTWMPLKNPREGLKAGHLDFTLDGEKLHGRYVLIRTRGDAKKPQWLLMKCTDEHVKDAEQSIVDQLPASVITGRTIEDILADVPPEAKKSMPAAKRAAKQKTTTKTPKRAAAGATTELARLPAFGSVHPQLATLVSDVPSGDRWIYEIKYDGYRTMAWLDDGKVKLASRKGLDWTKKYGPVADALARVRAMNAVFDGEIAYVGEDGRTDFQKLQATLGGDEPEAYARLVYFVFDLLFYDGVDLRDEPLSFRKNTLRTILAGTKPPLKMSEDLEDGAGFFREACKLGLEGIIGKRSDRPYHEGRSPDWVKVKCQKRQELVVVGFTPPKGGRKGIGALLLGVHDGKAFRYAGKVGTGFSNATLQELSKKLGPMEIEEAPVTGAPRMKNAHWVAPELVAEVRFTEWTADGVLRHPSFEGLRLDKSAREVVVEVEKAPPPPQNEAKPRVHGIVVSHPERVMDIVSGLSKLDVVRYAGEVASAMLPYVHKRPLMLLRCPGGIGSSTFQRPDRRTSKTRSSCFVQKHGGQGLKGSAIGLAMAADEEALFVRSAEDIVTLAQNNTVELHGWGSTFPKWDYPDWIVLDLDPDEALPFSSVIDSAFEIRDALRTLELESWVKTTGGKGLHVVVPIARRYDWETVRRVSQQIAVLMTQSAPKRYVATMTKAARVGKIFIDYLRNAEGSTAALPYSPRARPGLTVAYPVRWDDLRAVNPQELTITTVPPLLAKRTKDPWADLLTTRQTLPRELLAAVR